MANKSVFIGWDITFEDTTNKKTYDTEIVNVFLGEDVGSCIPMCTIYFSVNTAFSKYLIKNHIGKLKINNKTVITENVSELYEIELESVSMTSTIQTREEATANERNAITLIPVKYMCKQSTVCMNARDGGVYHKKKLEDIIKEEYNKTGCSLELKLETPDCKKQIDCIHLPEGSFIEKVRYLNQSFGLYNNMILMFGDTFVEKSPNWLISCTNKIKKEEITINSIPYEQANRKAKKITEKFYYTKETVNLVNKFTQNAYKLPKIAKICTLPQNMFMFRKDFDVAKEIQGAGFLSTIDQFDKFLKFDKMPYIGGNQEMTETAFSNLFQSIGTTAVSSPGFIVPDPFLLKHFRIGNIINYISQHQTHLNSDIKLVILGWMLNIKQGSGVGGGATWKASINLRLGASSYMDVK